MFRGMTDEEREVIDRALEKCHALETYPYTCDREGKRYIIVVDEIEDHDDCRKKYFSLMDDKGQFIKLPFCPSPYSGDRDIREWIEAGKPNDSKFHISNTARKFFLKKEELQHKYRSSGNQP